MILVVILILIILLLVGFLIYKNLYRKEVSNLLVEWLAALKAKNVDKILSLYAKNAILVPTYNNDDRPDGNIRVGREAMRTYFENFFKTVDSGKVIKQNIQKYFGVMLNSGTYDFTTPDGKIIKARFTFVYNKIGDKWLIINHHSSINN